MTKEELITYLEYAKTLEFAYYTNNTLRDKYFEKFDKTSPSEPKLIKVNLPSRPQAPEKTQNNFLPMLLTYLIFAIFSIIMGFGLITGEPFAFGIIFALIFIPGGAYGLRYLKRKELEEHKEYLDKLKRYESDYIHYENDLETHEELKLKYQNEYNDAMSAFKIDYTNFCKKKDAMRKDFANTSNCLALALNEHYEKNIIYPKYRNIVAISTIYEYLSSGRCFELEGPNGAYNMYEMEMRQNIIIGQLSAILRNLESIRNNQYVIYEEISSSNRIIHDMLKTVGDELKLSNYHANISNIIASSPKVVTGITI